MIPINFASKGFRRGKQKLGLKFRPTTEMRQNVTKAIFTNEIIV